MTPAMPTTATLERILGSLDGVTGEYPQYAAKCPAHDDDHASLSVGVGEDGTILLHCHAGTTGCPLETITSKVGVRVADLFPPSSPNGHRPLRPVIVATYDYLDEDGRLLFQVVRYSDKSFKQRQPDGKGGWIWNLKGVRRVLYRLPELLCMHPARHGEHIPVTSRFEGAVPELLSREH